MLGRTYPTYMGLGEFIVGFGQRRQQVKMAEAELQAQQNARFGQQVGQGIGNIIQVPAQQYLADLASQRQQNRQMALLDQQNAYRTANDYRDAFFQKYGTLPPTDAGAFQDTGSPALGASMDASGALGPPSVGVQQPPPPMAGVPAPISNPALTAEYQKKKAELEQMTMARDAFLVDPTRPQDEKDAFEAAMNPRIQATQSLLQRYPTPKPPTTAEEVMAQGGAVPIPGTYNYLMPDPKNGGYKVSTAVHPVSQESAPPITITAQDGTTQTIDLPPGGVQVLANGMVIRRNAKGDPDVEWPPKAGGKDGGIDKNLFGKAINAATDEDGKLNPDVAQQSYATLEATQNKIANLEVERKTLAANVSALFKMKNAGIDVRPNVARIAEAAKRLYGGPASTPADITLAIQELAE